MPELEVDSLLGCAGLQVFVLLLVDLSYELLVVSGDLELSFLHEQFQMVQHLFFFNVCEEDALNVAHLDSFKLVDYGVSYASFVNE